VKDFINGAMSFLTSWGGLTYPLGRPTNDDAFIAGGLTAAAVLLAALVFLALVFLTKTASAGEFYLEGAVGIHNAPYDDCHDVEWCNGSPGMAQELGKLAGGYQLDNGLFIEAEHISALQDRDRGLNTIWGGFRVTFK
jgi:hypothetical protein